MATANEKEEKAAVSGKGLERSQLAIAALMILSNLFVGITFACIVPFFPIEARAKGLSTSQVGLVIGILQLSTFFISPVFGKYMVILGINRAFIGGLCLTSFCTMALGLSPYLPFGTPFFVGVLLLRVGQSIGNASYSTSAWALIGHLFPERIVMFTVGRSVPRHGYLLRGVFCSLEALLEVAYGLGFTIGPVLGSILFEIGGFGLPLYSVGASFALVLVPSVILIRSNYSTATGNQEVQSDTAEAEEVPRVFQLLAIPDLFLSVTSMFLNSVCWYFYEPSLTDYMATFNLEWSPSMLSGFLLSIVSIVYIISAPVWSFLVEQYLSDQMRPMMLMVSVGMVIVTLLMGPSPLLGLPKSFLITTFAFGLLGFVSGIAYVPVFKWCIDAAKKKGLNGTSPGICGCVSSFIQSALSLGAFVATSLGGLSAQNLGFAWTATLVAGIQLIFIAVQIVYWLIQRRKSQRNDSIHPTA